MPSSVIRLPWPDRRLSPNARIHHMALATVKKSAKHAAMIECRTQEVPRNIDAPRLVAGIVFLPPDKRRRDLDNAIASSKALFDGIAEWIGVDDSRWIMTFEFGEPVKRGRVIVNLRWP